MGVSIAFYLVILSHYLRCNASLDTSYYPIFGTESSFQLNLDEEITYGSSIPSVSALEENIFAVTWAGTPKTRSIAYNENIYCRLFYLNEQANEPQLLLPTITINTFTNKSHHAPQISALSDHNNQISDSKRFAIVWHSDNLNGDFDGIYAKIIRWDYEEEERNAISVIILPDDELKSEFKVNDGTHSIIGEVDISPIFDIGRFAITWLAWNRLGHIQTYDVYSKVYDNYGSKSSPEFMVDLPSSKKQSEPSITAIYISDTSRSTYLVATWSVYDDVSDVTAIYSKLMNVGNDLEAIPEYEINETVMDGGIDVFAWDPTNGIYSSQYKNEAPDTTYLMQDYMMAVWSSTTSSSTQSEIHCAIYYVDIRKHEFVNVYDKYTINMAVHEVSEGVNYRNAKIDAMTCYQSGLDYTDFKNIDGATESDTCDVSICYQYDSDDLSKTYCSFWTISKGEHVRNITMHKYYEQDVEMTESEHHVMYPESSSWNRFYQDISSPINAKLLVVEQVADEDKGYGIYGRIIKYGNWSLEYGPNEKHSASSNRGNHTNSMLIVLLVVVFLVFLIGVVYACYYKQCKDGQSSIKKDIVAVNKKVFAQKTEIMVNKWSKYKKKWKGANSKRQYEVSGMDTDSQDTDVELGNDDDTFVGNKRKPKKKYAISGDSDSSSSDSVDTETAIGGGHSNRNLEQDSDSSDEQQQHQNNEIHVKNDDAEEENDEEEIEHSRVMLLKHEQYDVLQANLSSDDDSSNDDLGDKIKL